MTVRALAVIALAAALPLSGAARQDPLAGRVAGPPQHCIDTFTGDGPVAFDHASVVYRETARRIWISHPQGACPALREFTTLIVDRQGGTQLCDSDRFQVIAPGEIVPSADCRFGPWVPYTKAGR